VTPTAGTDRDAPVTVIKPSTRWAVLDLALLWQYRELLFFLGWRSIKVRYKQAAIGFGWAVLQPLLMMTVFTVIFGTLAKLPSDGAPYPVFALAALLPWNFFSQALTRSSLSLVVDSALLTKVYFPRALILLASCTAPLVDFLLSLLLLVGLMVWYGITPTVYVLTLPLFLLLAWLTAMAGALWLAPINVRYRDVAHALPFVAQLWMYASPVVYASSMIPARWRGLYALNPMAGVIDGFRWAILGQPAPSTAGLLLNVLGVGLLLLGGMVFFRRGERTFADVV
jgi:lipopolysaccharide transport system permease protein